MAVILSGCGNKDGTELHESILILLYLDQLKIPVQCLAPNVTQKQVVNHLTGEVTNEIRNALVESARIARGNVENIAQVDPEDYCGMIFPGGCGAGTNLSSFLLDGINYHVQKNVIQFAQSIARAKKPAGFICLSPSLIPAIYGNKVNMTLGQDPIYVEQMQQLGCQHTACAPTDVVVDLEYKVVSTAAYMSACSIAEVALGIEKLVQVIVGML